MVKYSEVLRKLKANGWYTVRQKGSHITLHHQTIKGCITFPDHGSREMGKGLLKSIEKKSGIYFRKR